MLKLLDKILEHNYFKTVSISVIVSFVIFNLISYTSNIIVERQIENATKPEEQPIKINIGNFREKLKQIQVQNLEHDVKRGENFSTILFNLGSNEYDVNQIIRAIKKIFNPTNIFEGQKLKIAYKTIIGYDQNTSSKQLVRKSIIDTISLSPDPEIAMIVSRQEDGSYKAEKYKKKLFKKIAKFSGTIANSLFVDGVETGVSPKIMIEMINLYSFNVDFQRDIRKGDEFEILFEDYFDKEGNKIKTGNILYSKLNLRTRRDELEAYIYKYKNSNEYFDKNGNSIKRSLLATPVNGARISSGFGYRRHPILGYRKKHRGLDFAAPRGTPILAAGKGTVKYVGRKGAYGNFVEIKHNDTYSTAYAHMQKFARGMRKGYRVRQGQVIGYIGSTGRSTGPHLHYEIRKKGIRINPAKFKGTANVKLRGKTLRNFKEAKNKIEKLLSDTQNQNKIL